MNGPTDTHRAFVVAFTHPDLADDEIDLAEQLLAGLDLRATALTTRIAALAHDAGRDDADIDDRASCALTSSRRTWRTPNSPSRSPSTTPSAATTTRRPGRPPGCARTQGNDELNRLEHETV
ncbi:hypothetical protein ACWCQQ_18815 [Streptomyces sp. NPDC002143]